MYLRRAKDPCVYMLASARDGIIYVGVTSSLAERISMHKQKLIDGFTKRFGVDRLVYYEFHGTMEQAIRRETQVKRWKRSWKVRLIQQMNPEWLDLFDEATREVFAGPADRERNPR